MSDTITVGEAIVRYIDSKRGVLSPSTIRGYYGYSKRYFIELQNIKIDKLNKEILQNSVSKMAGKYSPKSVKNAYGLLSAALRMFHSDFDLIKVRSLPKPIKPSFYVPDRSEIAYIYDIIKNTQLVIPFLLAAKCGLRPSEIAALTTDCIIKGTIEIRKAMVIDENGRQILKPPKTYSGYRSIPIPLEFEQLLRERAFKNKICPMTAKAMSDEWRDFMTTNGIQYFKFYALRHYFASEALLLGIPQKYIAEMMGHSSTHMIERVYQHIMKYAMDEFKERVKENIRTTIMGH